MMAEVTKTARCLKTRDNRPTINCWCDNWIYVAQLSSRTCNVLHTIITSAVYGRPIVSCFVCVCVGYLSWRAMSHRSWLRRRCTTTFTPVTSFTCVMHIRHVCVAHVWAICAIGWQRTSRWIAQKSANRACAVIRARTYITWLTSYNLKCENQSWQTATILKIKNHDISRTDWPILTQFFIVTYILATGP